MGHHGETDPGLEIETAPTKDLAETDHVPGNATIETEVEIEIVIEKGNERKKGTMLSCIATDQGVVTGIVNASIGKGAEKTVLRGQQDLGQLSHLSTLLRHQLL